MIAGSEVMGCVAQPAVSDVRSSVDLSCAPRESARFGGEECVSWINIDQVAWRGCRNYNRRIDKRTGIDRLVRRLTAGWLVAFRSEIRREHPSGMCGRSRGPISPLLAVGLAMHAPRWPGLGPDWCAHKHTNAAKHARTGSSHTRLHTQISIQLQGRNSGRGAAGQQSSQHGSPKRRTRAYHYHGRSPWV